MLFGKDIVKDIFTVLFKNCITHDQGIRSLVEASPLSLPFKESWESTTMEYSISSSKVHCCDQSLLSEKNVVRQGYVAGRRNCDVAVSSQIPRQDVAKTSQFRSQGVAKTSSCDVIQRCNITTNLRRRGDVADSLCAHWVTSNFFFWSCASNRY